MTVGGRWMTVGEFLAGAGISEDELRLRIANDELTAKRLPDGEYVWREETPAKAAASAPPEPDPPASAPPEPDPPAPLARAETMSGEPLVYRLTHLQELALQTERALSLVERSMSAFMTMHQEVVTEKERSYGQYQEALEERGRKLKAKEEALAGLERTLREKEQEIADLRMLVEILEGRMQKTVAPPTPEQIERATVGDLMEDQLRYLMEDQMINELLK
jgi:hypothetical protein